MASAIKIKSSKRPKATYLSGNFAPVNHIQPLTPCSYSGTIPDEFAGGEYVRNGANPVANEDIGRDAHWFDGDGMLCGVAFRRCDERGEIRPEFVNQYILTDLFLSSVASHIRRPILVSISVVANPLLSLFNIILQVFRTIILVFLSHLPGSPYAIKRGSVTNIGLIFHDGRALATGECGPPMRVSLPGLETIGWYNGRGAEGEVGHDSEGGGFGGKGVLGTLREWATAHPRVDPTTDELIFFHSQLIPPYVQYSVIPSSAGKLEKHRTPRLMNATVPGVKVAKMMHDFGVSRRHTIILDLPLSLTPMNFLKNERLIHFDPGAPSRFGIFPRHSPEKTRWFESPTASCIFHTANTWDDATVVDNEERTIAVNMLSCRLTSASIIYSAGDITAPRIERATVEQEEDLCQLYYHRFDLSSTQSNTISHQWALSAIPFDFPTLRDSAQMTNARYIYGCSTSRATFNVALGRGVKIDCLVKVDVHTLVQRGLASPPTQIRGCVDTRSMPEVIQSKDPNDPIKVFQLPPNWYGQEASFVPRINGTSEDDGWIVLYVFDESQLDGEGMAPMNATSELWIIDARSMQDIVARIHLPTRVPYGFHGKWFDEEVILNQKPIETIRSFSSLSAKSDELLEGNMTPLRRALSHFRRGVQDLVD